MTMTKPDGAPLHPLKIDAAKELAGILDLSDKEREELFNAFCSGRDDISDTVRENCGNVLIRGKMCKPLRKIVKPSKRRPSPPGSEEDWVSE